MKIELIADLEYLRWLNRAIAQLPDGPDKQAVENDFIAALIKLREGDNKSTPLIQA